MGRAVEAAGRPLHRRGGCGRDAGGYGRHGAGDPPRLRPFRRRGRSLALDGGRRVPVPGGGGSAKARPRLADGRAGCGEGGSAPSDRGWPSGWPGAGAVVTLADIDQQKAEATALEIGGLLCAPEAAHLQAAEVFAPCALGGDLSGEAVQALAAPIVCGAANKSARRAGGRRPSGRARRAVLPRLSGERRRSDLRRTQPHGHGRGKKPRRSLRRCRRHWPR